MFSTDIGMVHVISFKIVFNSGIMWDVHASNKKHCWQNSVWKSYMQITKTPSKYEMLG